MSASQETDVAWCEDCGNSWEGTVAIDFCDCCGGDNLTIESPMQGFEQGFEQGFAKGFEQGLEQGTQQALARQQQQITPENPLSRLNSTDSQATGGLPRTSAHQKRSRRWRQDPKARSLGRLYNFKLKREHTRGSYCSLHLDHHNGPCDPSEPLKPTYQLPILSIVQPPEGYVGIQINAEPANCHELIVELSHIQGHMGDFMDWSRKRNELQFAVIRATEVTARTVSTTVLGSALDRHLDSFKQIVADSNDFALSFYKNYKRTAEWCLYHIIRVLLYEIKQYKIWTNLDASPECHLMILSLYPRIRQARIADGEKPDPRLPVELWQEFTAAMDECRFQHKTMMQTINRRLQSMTELAILFPGELAWSQYRNMAIVHQLSAEAPNSVGRAVPEPLLPDVDIPMTVVMVNRTSA